MSIAHAIFIADSDILSYAVYWDGYNYNLNNSEGTRGTITFNPDGLVGVFRDDDSPRAPWRNKKKYSLDPYFESIPANLYNLARQEALPYIFDEYEDYHGPLITAAFWSDDEVITAAETWKDVVINGAHLIT